jgi:hypothetical protein
VAEAPPHLDLQRHRDLRDRPLGQVVRWVVVALLCAFVVAALLNVFGQRQAKSSGTSPAATMTVSAPSKVRGGLLYQLRVHVHALKAIQTPNVVLDEGWFQQTTVNAIEPQPSSESSQAGSVKLSYDAMRPGDTLTVWVYFQANPTNIGRHHTDVALDDGSHRLIHLNRTQFNFP